MIRTLIADDEELAREKLKYQLDNISNVKLVGEACDGRDTIKQITKIKPDLVLLDINMPYINGLEVLDVIEHPCQVIFTTAYDKFALQAFEKAAVDYLLKPFSLERLNTAIARVSDRISPCPDTLSLCSKIGAKTRILQISKLIALTSEDGQTLAHDHRDHHPLDASLDELSERLPSNFVRVHRNALINLNKLSEMQRWFNGNLLLKFHHSELEIITSRSGAAKIKQRLNY